MADYVGTAYGNEVLNYIDILIKGVEVKDDTIALEDIEELGPGGNYLTTEDTLDLYRTFWKPDILKQRTLEEYEKNGKIDISELYRKKIIEIIDKGPRKEVSAEIIAELDRMLAEAEAVYK